AVDAGGDAIRILQRYLDGYRVLAATSEGEIQRLGQREMVHAVVLASPPGREAGASVALGQSGLAHLPTIVCPFCNLGPVAPAPGIVDYLVKPITVARLRQALRRVDAKVRSVLVIDDDLEMPRLLERMIRSTGRRCRVWEARD